MPTPVDPERRETLRSIPLFRDFDEEALDDLVQHVNEFEVESGHVLAAPGLPGEGLFVIEEGTVAVDLPGRRVEMGPGECFGELALLTQEASHTARAVTVGRVKCFAIRRDDFDRLLEEQPKLAVSLLKVLAERLARRDRPDSKKITG